MKTMILLPLLLICLAAEHIDGFERRQQAHGSKPNIVVLLADDLGIGDLGCYGNTTLPTPNIDSLARDGAKFTHFLTAASVCTPSRAAFLTGRYPVRYGLSGTGMNVVILQTASSSGLPQEEVTFAEVVKEAGYETALIGKWHLGLHKTWPGDNAHNPLNQGFDYWFGIPLTNLKDYDDDETPVLVLAFPRAQSIASLTTLMGVLAAAYLWRKDYISAWTCFFISIAFVIIPQAPVWAVTHLKFLNSMLYRNFDLVEQPMHLHNLTQRLVNEGTEFLEKRHKDGSPFLLYMSWLQTHTVLHAGPQFQRASKHGRYGDEVMELDWSVGEILKALDRLGMHENTMVIFSSDHGGHVEERGKDGDVQGGYNGIYRGGKFQGGMDGGIRVPGIIRWPDQIAPQTEIDTPTSSMDLFPTVSEVVGVNAPDDRIIDGKSLLPLLIGETTQTEREYFIHYCSNLIYAVRFKPDQDGAIWKVRYTTPKWQPGTEGCGFICFCDERFHTTHDPPLVFDIASNPKENQPLSSDDPRFFNIIKAAENAIQDHKDSIGDVDNQFTFSKRFLRPHFVQCCNFPFCKCEDPKQ